MSFSIRKAFANKSVFLTGGTGFLGKVIFEKILYSLPEVKTVYLLVRPLKGVNPKQRLEKMLEDPLFERLHSRSKDFRSKVVLVEGDIMQDRLGISSDDRRRICNDVNFVIHSAAMVKFDRSLAEAVEPNFFGTRRVTQLCKEINNLDSFVHISTAYAQGDKDVVEEKIYPSPIPPLDFAKSLRGMSVELQEKIAPAIICGRPNTYAFAKALTESQVVEDVSLNIPIVIVRPVAISPTWNSPIPGWTDNVNSYTGVFLCIGKGLLTCLPGDGTSRTNIVPVDMTANMILASAADRATNRREGVKVMHFSSDILKWGQLRDCLVEEFRKDPPHQSFGVPTLKFCRTDSQLRRHFFFNNVVPSHIVDVVSSVLGKEKTAVKGSKKVWLELAHYFASRQGHFKTDNMELLWQSLDENKKKEFNFNTKDIDWNDYLRTYVKGIKKFILKEEPITTEKTERRMKKLRALKAFWYTVVGVTVSSPLTLLALHLH